MARPAFQRRCPQSGLCPTRRRLRVSLVPVTRVYWTLVAGLSGGRKSAGSVKMSRQGSESESESGEGDGGIAVWCGGGGGGGGGGWRLCGDTQHNSQLTIFDIRNR